MRPNHGGLRRRVDFVTLPRRLLHPWHRTSSASCDSSGTGQIRKSPLSLDHLGGAAEQRRRHWEAEGFRGLEVDHQFELFRGLDGQFARLRALKDAIGIDCPAPEIIQYYISIGEQAAKFNKVPQRIDRR